MFIFTAIAVLSPMFTYDFAQARLGDPNSYVPALVGQAFQHAPEMIDIARCESGIRQYNSDGSVLMGGGAKRYAGIFQVDTQIHTAAAAGLGWDIMTAEGNIAYARYMHSRSGTRPWASCVKGDVTNAPAPAPAIPTATPTPGLTPAQVPVPPAVTPTQPAISGPAVAATGVLTVNLNLGMSHPQVLILQKYLNSNGYVISAAGPGSPGSETLYFGSLTREALRKFQCAKGIACSGNESTTGYGRLGPMTRASMR